MKRISNLREMESGEVLTFPGTGSRCLVQGVTTVPLAFYAQGATMDAPVLFAYSPPGEFRFEIGHIEDFAVFFDKLAEGPVTVYSPPGAHVLVHTPEESWATVDHRPAINPELAAVLREMKVLRAQIYQSRVNERARAKRVVEPAPEPAPDPAPEPVAEPEPVAPDAP